MIPAPLTIDNWPSSLQDIPVLKSIFKRIVKYYFKILFLMLFIFHTTLFMLVYGRDGTVECLLTARSLEWWWRGLHRYQVQQQQQTLASMIRRVGGGVGRCQRRVPDTDNQKLMTRPNDSAAGVLRSLDARKVPWTWNLLWHLYCSLCLHSAWISLIARLSWWRCKQVHHNGVSLNTNYCTAYMVTNRKICKKVSPNSVVIVIIYSLCIL